MILNEDLALSLSKVEMSIRVTRNQKEIGAWLESPDSPFPLASLRHLMMPYQSSIFEAPIADESFIVFFEDMPVCCAYRTVIGGRLSYFDQPFRVEISEALLSQEGLKAVLQLVSKELWVTREAFTEIDIEVPVAGEKTNLLLEKLLINASIHNHYVEVSVNLCQPSDDIESGLRKSHRQSVSQGRKEMERVEISYGEIIAGAFDAFKALHLTAAGRETRPELSWELQRQAILNKNASLVTLTFDSRVVGASFCWLSRVSGLYGSAAYDRTLFSTLPIAHLGVFRAIQHAQNNGLGKFIVGEAYSPNGSEKEKGIAAFKRGFSNKREHFHRMLLSH